MLIMSLRTHDVNVVHVHVARDVVHDITILHVLVVSHTLMMTDVCCSTTETRGPLSCRYRTHIYKRYLWVD